MAITNPDVVRFSNENIRRMADLIVTLYNFSQGCQTQLASLEAAGLTNTSDVIVDGSPGDGRTPITGAQVLQFLMALNNIFQNAPLLSELQAVAVNPCSPDFSDLSWNQGE